MANDDIWAGDRLGRKEEAIALARFLRSETAYFAREGRDHAYVLALDAPYGEGKTWFLDRLRRHLEASHPVAHVDAWADDANEEPLVALMASVEDTLRPFLSKPSLQEKMASAKANILPVLGKGAAAFTTRLIGKHLGENFLEESLEALAPKLDNAAVAEGIKGASEVADEQIISLLDRAADVMLADYRKRKSSSIHFKKQLSAVVAGLSPTGKQKPPVFVIIDELDRCRPDYAIAMLEQIKHIFDIPGIVFIIALHGHQLQNSVCAVYGEKFDANDYLQRFFTRRYRLQQPPVAALASELFNRAGLTDAEFSYPPFQIDQRQPEASAALAFGYLLAHWKISPRRVHRVTDCLRMCVEQWHHPVELELLPLLHLIVNWEKSGYPTTSMLGGSGGMRFVFQQGSYSAHPELQYLEPDQMITVYSARWDAELGKSSYTEEQGAVRWVASRFQEEIRQLHKGVIGAQRSVMLTYPALIDRVGVFLRDSDAA